MIASIEHKGKNFKVNLGLPLDISIGLSPKGPRAWYVAPMTIKPVINSQFAGSVKLNGSVNFNDIYFNPHGHGTHTESVGHITREFVSVNEKLKNYFFMAELISIQPEVITSDSALSKKGDRIITDLMLRKKLGDRIPEALVIRTIPNSESKQSMNYSDTNFCYFTKEALSWLADIGVEHLLVDLPSVDREHDEGKLEAHRAFWKYPNATRENCTITEFVFVNDEIKDGTYLLNLQTAPFENDAAPSRPVLFELL